MPNTTQDLEQALQHLDQLQTQLGCLRSTLPTLVSPLIKAHTSKAELFAEIKSTATESTGQLATFRNDWNSEKTEQIISKARESEKKDPDLSKGQEVASFGWAGSDQQQV